MKNTYKIKTIIADLKNEDSEKDPIVIPEYQRDYVWLEDKIPFLLDSLYRGYPIGAITTWRKRKGEIQLLDGLQRTFSIINIDRNFDKYVNSDLLEYAIIKKAPSNSYFLEDKKHLRNISDCWSKIVSTEGLNSSIEQAKEKITTSDKYDAQEFEVVLSALKDIKIFKEKGFRETEIPYIDIPDTYKQSDITEIFKRLNSTGKSLNKFELYASIWSNTPFALERDNNDNSFVQDYIEQRSKLYAKHIGVASSKSPYLSNDKEINPSNYIYAALIRIISQTRYFYSLFIERKDNIDKIRDIETLSHIFLNYFGFKNGKPESFQELGKVMKIKLHNNLEESEKLIRIITKAFITVEKNIKLLSFSKSNAKSYGNVLNSLKLSSHIFVSMVNQVVNRFKNEEDVLLEENQLDNWLVYEVISKTYGGASSTKGWSAFKDERYLKPISKKINLGEKIINFFEEEEVGREMKTFSSTSKLILSYLQEKLQVFECNNLEIDHVIPKKVLKSLENIDVHTIYNLQLLPESKNKIKNKNIITDQTQFDFLASEDKENEYQIDRQLYIDLLENIERGYVKENYYKLINLRKSKMDKLIKERF